MKIKKGIIISSCPSPFVYNLAKLINSSEKFNCDILFMDELSKFKVRGSHWDCESSINLEYFNNNLKEYSFVISGLRMIKYYYFHHKISKQIKLIFYNERPIISKNKLISLFKVIFYFFNFQTIKPSAAIGIGDQAADYFSKMSNKNCLVLNFPYYLEKYTSYKLKNNISNEYKFIFSGQLIRRNNLFQLIKVFKSYEKKYQKIKPISLLIYGDGPLKKSLQKYINFLSLEKMVFINSERPKNWEFRLETLNQSDCLISIPNYSGWGLTIPEALSLGKYVITSSKAEAAKYYIRNGLNGIMFSKYNLKTLLETIYYVALNKKNNLNNNIIHSRDEYINFFEMLIDLI